MYPLRFGLLFLTGGMKNLIKNWLYLKALFYMVGTKSQITGNCLITVWLSPNIMFLLQAYATASRTLTVFCCVSITKIDILRTIAFRPNRLSQFKKKHGPSFFIYVNASVISIILIPLSCTLLLYCFTYWDCVFFLVIYFLSFTNLVIFFYIFILFSACCESRK